MAFRVSDLESLLAQGHRARLVGANVEQQVWRKIPTGGSWPTAGAYIREIYATLLTAMLLG
jgi:hypothetical protein